LTAAPAGIPASSQRLLLPEGEERAKVRDGAFRQPFRKKGPLFRLSADVEPDVLGNPQKTRHVEARLDAAEIELAPERS
jgi:hypothetical protein